MTRSQRAAIVREGRETWGLELLTPYVISNKEWGTRRVYVGWEHGRIQGDIPSFVHAFAHVYDENTDQYLGFMGVVAFRKACGMVDYPNE